MSRHIEYCCFVPTVILTSILAMNAPSQTTFSTDVVDPVAAGMDAERLALIPLRMQEFVDQGTSAGFVTLVARHGHVASFEAVGLADRDAGMAMRKDTIFQIKSLTKPITCLGIMQLVDDGRISLYDPVEKHLPEMKGRQVVPHGPSRDGYYNRLIPAERPITIRDLMTHTAGLEGSPPVREKGNEYQSLAEELSAIARQPLLFQPGEAWSYSNSGFVVMARIIEEVTGQSFVDYMQQRIFSPLDMTDTHFFIPADKQDRVARVYEFDRDNQLILAGADNDRFRPLTKVPSASGGLYSTAADLARFYQMMLNRGALDGKRLLSGVGVDVMTTVHTGDLPAGWAPGMGFGLGWHVINDPLGTLRYNSIGSYGHGGAYRTFGWVDPPKDMLTVLLYQRTNGGGDLADEMNAFLALAGAAIVDP